QLAIYLGWLNAGIAGATAVAAAFILPSFLMVLLLSAFYLRFGGLAWMQGAFYGIGAAVIAIIGRSAWKLMRSTLGRDATAWSIFLVSASITAWTESEIVWVFLLAGMVMLGVRSAALRRATVAVLAPWPVLTAGLHGPTSLGILGKILLYFAAAGAF